MPRRIEYWQVIELESWAKFELVPVQIHHDSFMFDKILDAVRKAGFNYRVIETSEMITEQGPCLP
jgi:hypothetical protein